MIAQSSKISFTAPIIQHEGMNSGYVEFQFSVEEVFGTRGMVKVHLPQRVHQLDYFSKTRGNPRQKDG